MKFGRLSNVDNVDFSLPPMGDVLLGWTPQDAAETFQLYVGAPVWTHQSFVGKIYPPKTRSTEFLQIYAKSFNCIELNSTFYGIPKPDRIERWCEQVGSEFRFCPKAPRSITHEAGPLPHKEILAFFRAMESFEDKLGATFFQFSPELGPKQWRRLQDIVELIPNDMEVAIELRNPDWFSSRKAREWLLQLGVKKGVLFVISDTAGRRDVLHYCFPQPRAFVRFSGDGLVPSDFARLDDWVCTLRELRSRGLKGGYFFLHQESEGDCVELAEHLVERLPEAGLPSIERAEVREQLALF